MDPIESSIDSDPEDKYEKKIDTSWFLNQEEMLKYINDPARKKKRELNPTEAIYQHGRMHRGFSLNQKRGNRKVRNPSPTKTQEERRGSPTIVEETADSLAKDLIDLTASVNGVHNGPTFDNSFLALTKPRIPGPVLTYKQLSDIYDRPHIHASKSPRTLSTVSTMKSTRSSCGDRKSPTGRSKSTSPKNQDVPFTAPAITKGKKDVGKVTIYLAKEQEVVMKSDKRRSTDHQGMKIAPVYVDYVNSLRRGLKTGILLPPFSLYVNTTTKSLREVQEDAGLDLLNDEERLEALKSMRMALYMSQVLDEVDLTNVNKKTEKGKLLLRKRQRAVEEELLLCILDYLTYVELTVLKAVSKSWSTVVYLKLYISRDLTLQPSHPKNFV